MEAAGAEAVAAAGAEVAADAKHGCRFPTTDLASRLFQSGPGRNFRLMLSESVVFFRDGSGAVADSINIP